MVRNENRITHGYGLKKNLMLHTSRILLFNSVLGSEWRHNAYWLFVWLLGRLRRGRTPAYQDRQHRLPGGRLPVRNNHVSANCRQTENA